MRLASRACAGRLALSPCHSLGGTPLTGCWPSSASKVTGPISKLLTRSSPLHSGCAVSLAKVSLTMAGLWLPSSPRQRLSAPKRASTHQVALTHSCADRKPSSFQLHSMGSSAREDACPLVLRQRATKLTRRGGAPAAPDGYRVTDHAITTYVERYRLAATKVPIPLKAGILRSLWAPWTGTRMAP